MEEQKQDLVKSTNLPVTPVKAEWTWQTLESFLIPVLIIVVTIIVKAMLVSLLVSAILHPFQPDEGTGQKRMRFRFFQGLAVVLLTELLF